MVSTAHAEHFLTRIDRLSARHAELALGLYRDHGLVRFLLSRLELADGTERVAVSLAEGDQGPFVVVTRDGRFVTCLGQGMRLSDDLPVVTRASLDTQSAKVEALRELMEASSSGKSRQFDQLVKRVLDAGHAVTQREFDDLVTWTPLAGGLYVEGLIRSLRLLERTYPRLQAAKRIGKRSESTLRLYWQALWSVLHLTTLVGDQPEHIQRRLAQLDVGTAPSTWLPRLFIMPLWKTGLLAWATRAAWLAARMPKVFLKPLKEGFDAATRAEHVSAYGSSLAAIGYRHRRYRKEIGKLLRRPHSQEESPIRHFGSVFGGLVSKGYDSEILEKMLDIPREDTEAFTAQFGAFLHDKPEHRELLAQMTDKERLAMMFTLPMATDETQDDFSRNICYLPGVSRMNARDFYLPERYRPIHLARLYHPKLAQEYARPRLAVAARHKPKPSRAPTTPGRNEPCPCGSGKKFKRCCARTASPELG